MGRSLLGYPLVCWGLLDQSGCISMPHVHIRMMLPSSYCLLLLVLILSPLEIKILVWVFFLSENNTAPHALLLEALSCGFNFRSTGATAGSTVTRTPTRII
ncbi:Uncharacterized protein TCM_020746 [Theobroma cacao]|uniref:Uncharacterized protein n=1 Tax=Theobroma cacao TaxID=3641 RepID=A0A061ENA9_THECC|nr:Uncharacterized protein TCM_020746 [Theobroma cacao]